MDFTETMRLKGKAEEDIYFAKQSRILIEALREQAKADARPKDESEIDNQSPEGAQLKL